MNKLSNDQNHTKEYKKMQIALVGNPNVGKSIFFNYLTNIYVEVSNFPGTTVEIYHGTYKNYIVYDTPGIYSVSSFNDEEKVAKDIIVNSDIIINVVDATHLERDLFLTTQLIEMGKKIIIALNMYDELKKYNLKIDVKKLSLILGVPVIPKVAPEKKGFKELEEKISEATNGIINKEILKELELLKELEIPTAEKLLILEEDKPTIVKYAEKLNDFFIGKFHFDSHSFKRPKKHLRRRHHHGFNKHRYYGNYIPENKDEELTSNFQRGFHKKHFLKKIMRHYLNRDRIYLLRRLYVNSITTKVISPIKGKESISKIIGNLIIKPQTGIPISIFILYLIYLFIGVFIAGDVVKFTEGKIGNNIFEYNLKKYIAYSSSTLVTVKVKNENDSIIKVNSHFFEYGIKNEIDKFHSLENEKKITNSEIKFTYSNPILTILFGDFGILTMTITYILFLLLPLVIGFYFMLSILEDSGYLPRLATLVDKLLSYIGLNGRAIIPIILGFGCVTMATITTRILGSKRERTIATTILQLAIPCSAQLGVIATLLASVNSKVTIIYIIIIFIFLTLTGTILNKFIKGESTPLIIDLPPMRLPRPINVFKKTYYRSYGFMKEASPWFFFGALIISIMQITGALDIAIKILNPLVVKWLKLPEHTAIAFVMGLVRRDFGAAGLYGLPLSSYQVLVAIITLTLFVPCVTSLIVMFKERGPKEGIIIWFSSLTFAFFIGGIIAQIFL